MNKQPDNTIGPQTVSLNSDFCTWELNMDQSLRECAWSNKLSEIDLTFADSTSAMPFSVEVDRSYRRLFPRGWRYKRSVESSVPADQDPGYQSNWQNPGFDDSAWSVVENLSVVHSRFGGSYYPDQYYWARTSLFVPDDCQDVAATLVFGGFGLYDFGYIRVFVNGIEVGTRIAPGYWNQHGRIALTTANDQDAAEEADNSRLSGLLRYGEHNSIVFQMKRKLCRNRDLNAVDPEAGHWFPFARHFGTVFDSYVIFGQDTANLHFELQNLSTESDAEGNPRLVVDTHPDRDCGIRARLQYTLSKTTGVLSKQVSLTTGSMPVRLMSICLGDYRTDRAVSDGYHCGFPVYTEGSFFFALKHPAGWVMGEDQRVLLAQYPGTMVAANQTFQSMEAIFGVSKKGQIAEAFVQFVRDNSRRVLRAHDKVYAIYSALGGWDNKKVKLESDYDESETMLLDTIGKIDELHRQSGFSFDVFNIDFWNDHSGDLKNFHGNHFPHGAKPVIEAIENTGARLGLWIDSSFVDWSIGQNPQAIKTYNCTPEYHLGNGAALCWRTEFVQNTYTEAFKYHIAENGAKLIKFDNFCSYCYNTDHDHLPGLYSKEHICNGFIDFLSALDAADPDVFLMLYWGYRSPWWLLYADTLFESGILMEGASPATEPTLFVRDGVIRSLDQAQWWSKNYIPSIGKDSLGVWFSRWKWNSQIGRERWQEAFVMDMCRGSLLAQPWGDQEELDTAERAELTVFVDLMRARTACFARPELVFGNPWQTGIYGYKCSDGQRSFLGVTNGVWQETSISLKDRHWFDELADQRYAVYRWYPEPAQIVTEGRDVFDPHDNPLILYLRPFEVALYEIVPANGAPSLGRSFAKKTYRHQSIRKLSFAVESKDDNAHLLLPLERLENTNYLQQFMANDGSRMAIELQSSSLADQPLKKPALQKRSFTLQGQLGPAESRSLLAVAVQIFQGDKKATREDMGMRFALRFEPVDIVVAIEPCVKELSYPSNWQVFRVELGDINHESQVDISVTVFDEPNCDYRFDTWIINGPAARGERSERPARTPESGSIDRRN